MSRNKARTELWNLSWSDLFELFGLCDMTFKAAHDVAAAKLLAVSRAFAIMPQKEFQACTSLAEAVTASINYLV